MDNPTGLRAAAEAAGQRAYLADCEERGEAPKDWMLLSGSARGAWERVGMLEEYGRLRASRDALAERVKVLERVLRSAKASLAQWHRMHVREADPLEQTGLGKEIDAALARTSEGASGG